MKTSFQVLVIVLLVGVYLLVIWAIMHPHVNQAYRDFYIDRSTTDWNPTRYAGTPQQGMKFVHAGLPEWVDSTYGLSVRDETGRWTDAGMADTPSITFRRNFTGPLCVVLDARPGPSLKGMTFSLRMGDQTRQLQIVSDEFAEYRAQFDLAPGANRLDLLFPVEPRPASDFGGWTTDSRRLGVELKTLQISSGHCADIPQPARTAATTQVPAAPERDACVGVIDKVDGAAPHAYITLVGKHFAVDGWLAVSTADAIVPDEVYVTLTDQQDKTTYIKTTRTPRNDVKQYFKHPDMPDLGYEAVVDASQLKGKYILGLARVYQGQQAMCQKPQYPVLIDEKR